MHQNSNAAAPTSPNPAVASPCAGRAGTTAFPQDTRDAADKMTGLRRPNQRVMRSLRSHRSDTSESTGFVFGTTDGEQTLTSSTGPSVMQDSIPSHVQQLILNAMPEWREDGTACLPMKSSTTLTGVDESDSSVSSHIRHSGARDRDATGDLTDGGYYATPSYSAVEASLSVGNTGSSAIPTTAKRTLRFAKPVGGEAGGEVATSGQTGTNGSHPVAHQRRARRGSTSVTIRTPSVLQAPSASVAAGTQKSNDSTHPRTVNASTRYSHCLDDDDAQTGRAGAVQGALAQPLLQRRRSIEPPAAATAKSTPVKQDAATRKKSPPSMVSAPTTFESPPSPSARRANAKPVASRAAASPRSVPSTAREAAVADAEKLMPLATPPPGRPALVTKPANSANPTAASKAEPPSRRAGNASEEGKPSTAVALPALTAVRGGVNAAASPRAVPSPAARHIPGEEDEEDAGVRPGGGMAQFYSRAQLVQNPDGAKYLNDYMVFHDVGRGASGKVVMGYSAANNRTVAIKIITKPKKKKYNFLRAPSILTSDQVSAGIGEAGLQPDGIASAQGMELQLQREIDVMKNLNHKNIVCLYEVINDPTSNKIYLIMQFIDKGAVASMDADGKLQHAFTSLEVARIAAQAASGLAYLHKKGVVHRDIKPENILMNSEGNVFLADFGVAEMFPDEDAVATVDKLGFQGTPLFMAPEAYMRPGDVELIRDRYGENQGSSANILSSKTTPGFLKIDLFALDIWALGVTLITLLTGEVPLKRVQDIRQLLLDGKDSLPLPLTVPKEWRPLITSMVQTNPKMRPTSNEVRVTTKKLLEQLEKEEKKVVVRTAANDEDDEVMVVSDNDDEDENESGGVTIARARFVPLNSKQFSPATEDAQRAGPSTDNSIASHSRLTQRRTNTTTNTDATSESRTGAGSTLPSLPDTASRSGQSPVRADVLKPNFVGEPLLDAGSPAFVPLTGMNSGPMFAHRRSITSGVNTPAIRRSTAGDNALKGSVKASLYKGAMNEKMK